MSLKEDDANLDHIEDPHHHHPKMVVVTMGVCGCGKSTVGALIARRLGWPFYEGDDYHPAANVDKMRRGEALGDADREPWLAALAAVVQRHAAVGAPGAVLSCSALKPAYRAAVCGCHPREKVGFVLLEPGRQALAARLAARTGHFMPASLLDSQLEALEYDPAELFARFSGDFSAEEAAEAVVEQVLLLGGEREKEGVTAPG